MNAPWFKFLAILSYLARGPVAPFLLNSERAKSSFSILVTSGNRLCKKVSFFTTGSSRNIFAFSRILRSTSNNNLLFSNLILE